MHETIIFLNLLSRVHRYYFVALPEGACKNEHSLHWRGWASLDEALPRLTELNERGAGIFVVVNELMDGTSATNENVTGIRAVFHDHDNKGEAPSALPLAPSLVVETSPGKQHRYLLTDNSASLSTDGFVAVMDRMVSAYGSDPACKGLSRLMRLPGFLNNKASPGAPVRLLEASGYRYTGEQLLAAFEVQEASGEPSEAELSEPYGDAYPDVDKLRSALSCIPSDERGRWFGYGAAIYDAFEGNDTGWRIWDEWSRTSVKYDEREQLGTWREFGKRTYIGRPVTLGSIYYDAEAEFGWEAHNDDLPDNRVADWADLDELFGSHEYPLTTVATEALRAFFAECKHAPSEGHWDGIRDILRSFEAMQKGFAKPMYYLSALPCGMGKTTTVIEATKALVSSDSQTGVIYFLWRIAEIKLLAERMGLQKHQFACLTSDDEVNRLGSDDVDGAQVLFTTQNRLEKLSNEGTKAFADIKDFHYQGRPRTVRVWDEAISPTRELLLKLDNLAGLFSKMGEREETRQWLGQLRSLYADLVDRTNGHIVEIPAFEALTRAEFAGLFDDEQDTQTAKTIYDLAGHECRLRVDGNNTQTTLAYTELLPNDLAPMLILDASGGLREVYPYWEKYRGNVVRLKSPPKGYAGLTIHHWHKGAGRDAQKKGISVVALASGIAKAINDEVPHDEDVLVILRKRASNKDPDFEGEIKQRVSVERVERVKFLTWGMHTATNEFARIRYVVQVGMHQYPEAQYEAMGRGAKAATLEEEFSEDELRATKLGEIKHNMFQAICRGAVRYAENGECPTGCHVYIVFSTHSTMGTPRTVLGDTFPGARVVSWKPLREGIDGQIVEALVEYTKDWWFEHEETVSAERLANITRIDKTNVAKYAKKAEILDDLASEGITLTSPRKGKWTIKKAGFPK